RLGLARHLGALLTDRLFVTGAVLMRGGGHRLRRALREDGARFAFRQRLLKWLKNKTAQREIDHEEDRDLDEDREIRGEIHNDCLLSRRAAQASPAADRSPYSLTGLDVG